MKKISTLLILISVATAGFSQYTVPSGAGVYQNPGNGTVQPLGGSTLVWQSPGNTLLSDNNRSATPIGSRGITEYLRSRQFGFTFPAPCPSCIVGGIEAQIQRRSVSQPDVVILNSFQSLLPIGSLFGGQYVFPITPANPPTIMNRALVVIIGIENGPRPANMGGPVNPPLPNNDSRDVTAVTYGGVPMIQACEVAYSNIVSGTSFWARNEIWFLNDAGISAAVGNGINITNPGNSYEYVEYIHAVSLRNVDQLAPIFDSRTDTIVGAVNPFSLGNPAPMRPGSCAITSVVNGNAGTYSFANGGASGILGCNFQVGIQQNGALLPLNYSSSTPTMMSGYAYVPNNAPMPGSVAPSYSFSATSNRQVLSMICVQRARDFDNEVRLRKNSGIVGLNYANPFTYPVIEDYQSYGGPADLWGTTWTTAEIANNEFGLLLSSRVQNRQVEVNHMRLKIYLYSTLPVELVGFNGERIDREIQLKWSTSSEVNNDYFELHRSPDAVNYELISTTDGAGNSNNLIDYIYNDATAPADAISYYKIRQVDFDGNYKWYGPVSVDPANRNASLSLFPNPAVTTITVGDLSSLSQYVIYDLGGKVIKAGRMDSNTIDIDELNVGVYFISIGTDPQRIKFIKL